jgi:Phage integrase, N-terminal SAM-like domain
VALPNGRRRTFYGKTREDVEAKLLDARHAFAHRRPVEAPRSLSLATFLRDWIADQQAYLRPRTWVGYQGNVDNHIIKSIGKLKLAELRPADVRRLHRDCAARDLSKRTVEYVHTILHKGARPGRAGSTAAAQRGTQTQCAEFAAPKGCALHARRSHPFLAEVRGEPEETLYVVTLWPPARGCDPLRCCNIARNSNC